MESLYTPNIKYKLMKKQIVKINKNIVKAIQNIDGGTYDKKVNVLMDKVDKEMPFVKYTPETSSMTLYPDTLQRLDNYRITYTESRSNILTRLLIAYENLTENIVEEWIPFKITNKYNNLLVIDGQMEYNSQEISFNYRGNVYPEKLPPTYIVNGQNLTKELYLWYDDLDKIKIKNHILQNKTSKPTIEEDSYILEINNI